MCTLITSRMNLMVKVVGQRSRSPGQKMWFFLSFRWADLCRFILSCHIRHVTAWCDVMASWRQFDVFGQEYWQRGLGTGGLSMLRPFHFICQVIKCIMYSVCDLHRHRGKYQRTNQIPSGPMKEKWNSQITRRDTGRGWTSCLKALHVTLKVVKR